MSQPSKARELAELLPCPFCGGELTRGSRKINPSARCTTEDCFGGKSPVVNLDVPQSVAGWNTRALSVPPCVEAAGGIVGYLNLYRREDGIDTGGTDLYDTADEAAAFSAAEFEPENYLGVASVSLLSAAPKIEVSGNGKTDGNVSVSLTGTVRVPDGWKLVPVEPTEDMVCTGDEAAITVLQDHTFMLRDETLALKVYRAILSAAPTPPAETEGPSDG